MTLHKSAVLRIARTYWRIALPPLASPLSVVLDRRRNQPAKARWVRFAPPLSRSPFIPAKAGIQGPRIRPRTGSPLPRGRTELRGDSNSSHLALGLIDAAIVPVQCVDAYDLLGAVEQRRDLAAACFVGELGHAVAHRHG